MGIKKSSDEKMKEDMPFAEKEKDGSVASADLKSIDAGFTPEQMGIIEDLQRQIAEGNANNAAVSKALKDEGQDAMGDLLDDYLEVPCHFFAFSSWFGIYGDKRFNRESMPPRGEKIEFQKLYRYQRNKSSRGIEVVSVSQAVVRSKETAEWLRTHSLFGIKFFENIEKAQNVNVTLAEKMTEMNAVVSNMSDYIVIERSKRENIPVQSADVRELRKMLIRTLADAALKNEKHVHEVKLKSGNIDEEGRSVEYKKLGDLDADLRTS